PVVVWQRILPFPPSIWRPGRRQFWQAVTRRIDAAVALTNDDRTELRRLGFTKTVHVIPNFRRLSRFAEVERQQAEARLRDRLGVGADVRLLGLVGHLIAQKRPERALDVLRGVREDGIDAHLVVAGDGPLRQALVGACEREDLTPFVHVLGTVSDVGAVLGGLDALLLTSDSEGIPGIVIEAQMCALPVVTFDLGGIATVVVNNVTGAIVAAGDVAAMARRTSELLRDETRNARMRKAAREHAAVFATERVARDYEKLLRELTAQRHPPSFGESGQMARAKSGDL
ncbi:MAG TPA: glycosyltransferase family 4 protein, partial [Acidimicrobiia bacterium]|nr:glycosyltransferase family 4 protein [Acidimicrobiia bacterium]